MDTIYDQHDAAFLQVSAFVIARTVNTASLNHDPVIEIDRVATIAFKFPKDGAGRLYCYLHVLGLPMVRGMAGGYGYDKRTAAFEDAAKKQASAKLEDWQTEDGYAAQREIARAILASFEGRGGHDWQANLRHAGLTVLQAV
jgi:hypothetical protein